MKTIELIRSIKSFDFIDDFDVKTMFGGKRLFSNGVPFCQFLENKFYFRASACNVSILVQQGFEQLVTYKNNSPVKHNYFVVPEDEINDCNKLKTRLACALEESLQEKESALRNQRIKDLPNLRPHVERALSKVGITSVSELRNHGPVSAFIKLRQFNENVPLDLLYSLSAALKGIHKNVLSSNDKQTLLMSLEMSV